MRQEVSSFLREINRRYARGLSLLQTLNHHEPMSAEQKEDEAQDKMKKAVMSHYQRYQGEEHGFIEFCRKADWLTNYGRVVNYPFIHFENRIDNAISWLQFYQNKISFPQDLKNEINQTISNLAALRAMVRSSYEYQQEQNLLTISQHAEKASNQVVVVV